MNITLGTPEPAVWMALLILKGPAEQVIPLWAVSLPVTAPPTLTSMGLPLPGRTWTGIYSGLFTEEGPQAVALEWTYSD